MTEKGLKVMSIQLMTANRGQKWYQSIDNFKLFVWSAIFLFLNFQGIFDPALVLAGQYYKTLLKKIDEGSMFLTVCLISQNLVFI